MYERDLVVAVVAMGLGAAMIRGMWIDSDWCFRLNSAATLESSFGRTGARWIISAIGAALIWMGGQLVVGPFLVSEPSAGVDAAPNPDRGETQDISGNEWGARPFAVSLIELPI